MTLTVDREQLLDDLRALRDFMSQPHRVVLEPSHLYEHADGTSASSPSVDPTTCRACMIGAVELVTCAFDRKRMLAEDEDDDRWEREQALHDAMRPVAQRMAVERPVAVEYLPVGRDRWNDGTLLTWTIAAGNFLDVIDQAIEMADA